jgi:hypothetical protein
MGSPYIQAYTVNTVFIRVNRIVSVIISCIGLCLPINQS